MNADAHYFARRASEERAAAMQSPHLKARAAHLEMARRYQDLADAITDRMLAVHFDVAGAA